MGFEFTSLAGIAGMAATLPVADNDAIAAARDRQGQLTKPPGSLGSLEEVVAHYNQGGEAHINRSKWIRPLGLSEAEVGDLVRFLESLTDRSFLEDARFRE